MPEPVQPLPRYPVWTGGWTRRYSRRWIAASLALGGALSLLLTVSPVVILGLGSDQFAATATPDSGFNIYILGALALFSMAALLSIVAVVFLFFQNLRWFGIGYLSGLFLFVLMASVLALLSALGA